MAKFFWKYDLITPIYVLCANFYDSLQICGGITYDNYARRIWASYYKLKATLNDIVNAHEIAQRMLDKYRIEHLSIIMSLPPHKVFVGDVSTTFSEHDKKRNKLNCPRIYLTHRRKQY